MTEDDYDETPWKVFLLGREGLAPRTWQAAVRTQLQRLVTAREDFRALGPPHLLKGPIEPVMRLEFEAHFLLVAIRNVIRSASVLSELLESGELDVALATFEREFTHASYFRDYATHFDAYVLGKGHHQKSGTVPPDSTLWHIWWQEDGSFRFMIGDREISLGDVAEAAINLAEVAHRSLATYQDAVAEAAERTTAEGDE
jgi:hypothetical protein